MVRRGRCVRYCFYSECATLSYETTISTDSEDFLNSLRSHDTSSYPLWFWNACSRHYCDGWKCRASSQGKCSYQHQRVARETSAKAGTLQYFFLTVVFYTLTNGMNKFAFLMLYYRVFPIPSFRKVCWIMMAISGAWTVSFLFVGIFQCNPVARVYNRKIPGTCINFAWHRYVAGFSSLEEQRKANMHTAGRTPSPTSSAT